MEESFKFRLIKMAFFKSLTDFVEIDRVLDSELTPTDISSFFKNNPEKIKDLELMLKNFLIDRPCSHC